MLFFYHPINRDQVRETANSSLQSLKPRLQEVKEPIACQEVLQFKSHIVPL